MGTLEFLPATLLADHLYMLPSCGIVSDLLNPPVGCKIVNLKPSLPKESLNTEHISDMICDSVMSEVSVILPKRPCLAKYCLAFFPRGMGRQFPLIFLLYKFGKHMMSLSYVKILSCFFFLGGSCLELRAKKLDGMLLYN